MEYLEAQRRAQFAAEQARLAAQAEVRTKTETRHITSSASLNWMWPFGSRRKQADFEVAL